MPGGILDDPAQVIMRNPVLQMDPAAQGFHTQGPGGILGFHATGRQFDKFEPSKFRGATFFSRTPEGARAGASAGVGDLTGSGSSRLVGAILNPQEIMGLYPTPKEVEWWNSLPDRATGDEMDAALKDNPTNFDHWYQIYKENKLPDGSFEYIKNQVPSITWDEAINTGRDVYGQQIAHYGPQTSERNTAAKAVANGMNGFLQADEGGISIGHANPGILNPLPVGP